MSAVWPALWGFLVYAGGNAIAGICVYVHVCVYVYAHGVLIRSLRTYKRRGRYYHTASAYASRNSDLACCFVPRALALALLAVVAPVDTAQKPP